jgi:hypothetical protein
LHKVAIIPSSIAPSIDRFAKQRRDVRKKNPLNISHLPTILETASV